MSDHVSRYYTNPRNPAPYVGKKPSDDFDWDTAITRWLAILNDIYR